MKQVGVCGHFGIGLTLLNGQTIKTKIITEELENQLGVEQVEIVDTHGGAMRVPGMCIDTFKLFKNCKNIFIAPAHRGLLLYVPMCILFNCIFNRKIHYVVIGGWLDSYLNSHSVLERMLKRFTTICVETSTMKRALEKRGFSNIVILPNCKNLKMYDFNELPQETAEPYKLCTFSRVMKEKGIEDIIDVVKSTNEKLGRTVYVLDIYGEVWNSYTDEFETLQKTFPEYISYKGKVAFDQSAQVLSEYFALVFPTKFYTEGIPGTIIDAYAAGIPVISAKWESYDDVVDEGITGIGYEFGNNSALEKVLLDIAENPQLVWSKKSACLEKAKEFLPANVIGKFIECNI